MVPGTRSQHSGHLADMIRDSVEREDYVSEGSALKKEQSDEEGKLMSSVQAGNKEGTEKDVGKMMMCRIRYEEEGEEDSVEGELCD